jgi:LruC domain-containing protein
MKLSNYCNYFLFSLLIILGSCEPNGIEIVESEAVISLQSIENFSIPDDFNFGTERIVTLTITDDTPFVKYEVFGYSSRFGNEVENITDALHNMFYSGRPSDGIISHVFSLSSIYDRVYISRKDGLEYSFEIKDITNNIVDFTSPFSTRSANKSTCPNESSVSGCPGCEYIFENGDFECGPSLPDGPGNGNVDILISENACDGWSSTTNKIRIIRSGWEIDGNPAVPAQNGLYFSELNSANANGNGNHLGKDMYQRVCTTPGTAISWSLWHRGRDGIDEAVVKIGPDLANMIVVGTMTTANTAWQNYTGTYTVPVGQYDTYFMLEAVSTSSARQGKGNFVDHVVLTETNGGSGGSCDPPPIKICYPSCGENATIGFEDLWPRLGDYDFNDLVISYNIELILNAQNNVTRMDYSYTVESVGAAFTNGYGVELEGVSPSAISSVTGSNLTEGFIVNDANGTEQGQRNAVIVFFDNADIHVGIPNTISIEFSSPITTAALGAAPFNPFLIKNTDRNTEIHLPTKPVTSYPTLPIGSDDDMDGDFKDADGLPWAINFSGQYAPPLPGVKIWIGYNHFLNWAHSGGVQYPNWFVNDPGNRNNNFLNN